MKKCSCKRRDHEPFNCGYPNGCTGCTCESPVCRGRSYCDLCGEYTVHPELHSNEAVTA